MASVERTAYPRFRRLVTARELATLTPSEAEIAWATERTRSDDHLLALAVTLKCFQRLGYFPPSDEVPSSVVDHVRCCLDLPEGTRPVAGARTAKAHRDLVRSRSGVILDPKGGTRGRCRGDPHRRSQQASQASTSENTSSLK